MIINIAFCFDEKVYEPSCVTIASLLDAEKNPDVHYHMYCISSELFEEHRNQIRGMIRRRDPESVIQFLEAPTEFKDAHLREGFSQDTYTALLMHRLLPGEDKVIYIDTDTLIKKSLVEMWNIDVDSYRCAGVLGTVNLEDSWNELMKYPNSEDFDGVRGKYINDGVLIINLKRMREWNPDALFLKLSKKEYRYLEQDIFSFTCKDEMLILHPKYNVYAYMTWKKYMEMVTEGFLTEKESKEAFEDPVILHYAGPKPWNNRGVFRAKEWWNYVEQQPDLNSMFDKKKIPCRKTTGLLGKINRHLPF